MKTLRTSPQTLTMENVVHSSGVRPRAQAICVTPFPGKCQRILAAALKTRSVSRRERRRLIKKKQLGIGAPPDVAMPPLEIEHAADPLPRRPAAAGERPCIHMEPAAAVAHEQPTRRHSDEIAKRRDSILQRHRLYDQIAQRRGGYHRGVAIVYRSGRFPFGKRAAPFLSSASSRTAPAPSSARMGISKTG